MAKFELTLQQQHVIAVILEERKYQDHKWGPIKSHPHEVGSWLMIMDQLLDKAKKNWMTLHGDIAALDELRQVVAVGFACMEQHGVPNRMVKEHVKAK